MDTDGDFVKLFKFHESGVDGFTDAVSNAGVDIVKVKRVSVAEADRRV